MKVQQTDITREEVIRFYAEYDRRKKGQAQVDFTSWAWADPDRLDRKLKDVGLKDGVLAAYRAWDLATLGIPDLLECAVVNHIFPSEPQAVGQLVLRGKLADWLPKGAPSWWCSLANGLDLGREEALILRPALPSEAPANWYLEDGSGRALALVQRILRYGETSRIAWAYVGKTPDEHSRFIKSPLGRQDSPPDSRLQFSLGAAVPARRKRLV